MKAVSTEHRTLTNSEHRTSNSEHRMFNILHSLFGLCSNCLWSDSSLAATGSKIESLISNLKILQHSMFSVRCSKFASVGRSMFGLLVILSLLIIQQAAASIQLAQIDLGALPVEKVTTFELTLPFTGEPQLLTGVESSCSCLVVNQFPETLETGENHLKITFKPNDTGPSQVSLTFNGIDVETGEQVAQVAPVAVVGVADTKAAELQEWIQRISPEVLYTKLARYKIIDVRGSEDYKKAHIPGSFEYTLDAFVALADQFKEPIVLVGDGLLSAREVALLGKRGSTESPLFWLVGGLPAWMRQGLPVQGIWPSRVDVSTISLQRWLETGGSSQDWEIVDLNGKSSSQGYFFGRSMRSYDRESYENMGAFLLEVQEDFMRSPDSPGLLVIGDEKGLGHTSVEHNMADFSTVPLYYLSQGDAALPNWLASTRDPHLSVPKSYRYSSAGNRSSASKSSRVIRSSGRRGSGCSSCPGR